MGGWLYLALFHLFGFITHYPNLKRAVLNKRILEFAARNLHARIRYDPWIHLISTVTAVGNGR